MQAQQLEVLSTRVKGHAGHSAHRWGGEPELVMAVNVIRRPITVHHLVEGIVTPIVTYVGARCNCAVLKSERVL